jgi:amino acid transporter
MAQGKNTTRIFDIGWQGFLLRFAAGLILVFATYNYEEYSYYHWIKNSFPPGALQAFVGVLLIVGWAIYIRAALRSLGIVGLLLATAFFGTLIWLIVDVGLVSLDNMRVISYLVQILLAMVLSTGLSWSHVRRRLSGQMDTDDV